MSRHITEIDGKRVFLDTDLPVTLAEIVIVDSNDPSSKPIPTGFFVPAFDTE